MNNSCQTLVCEKGSVVKNHTCVTCDFFEFQIGNECITDKILIGSLTIELISWIIIFIIGTLLVMKIKRKSLIPGSQGVN